MCTHLQHAQHVGGAQVNRVPSKLHHAAAARAVQNAAQAWVRQQRQAWIDWVVNVVTCKLREVPAAKGRCALCAVGMGVPQSRFHSTQRYCCCTVRRTRTVHTQNSAHTSPPEAARIDALLLPHVHTVGHAHGGDAIAAQAVRTLEVAACEWARGVQQSKDAVLQQQQQPHSSQCAAVAPGQQHHARG